MINQNDYFKENRMNKAELAVQKSETARENKIIRDAQKALCKSYLTAEKENMTPDVFEAFKALTGAFKEGRLQRPGVNDALRSLFLDRGIAGEVTSIEIFELFEFGAPEMAKRIRQLINSDKPVWISYENKVYTLKGIDTQPEDWTGYVHIRSETL